MSPRSATWWPSRFPPTDGGSFGQVLDAAQGGPTPAKDRRISGEHGLGRVKVDEPRICKRATSWPGGEHGNDAVERRHDGLALASWRVWPLRGVALGPGYCWRRDFLRLCVGLGPLAFDLFVEPGTQGFKQSVDFTLVVAEDHEAA
jgi:hypothetical protein